MPPIQKCEKRYKATECDIYFQSVYVCKTNVDRSIIKHGESESEATGKIDAFFKALEEPRIEHSNFTIIESKEPTISCQTVGLWQVLPDILDKIR